MATMITGSLFQANKAIVIAVTTAVLSIGVKSGLVLYLLCAIRQA
jgi:hypothetical protein